MKIIISFFTSWEGWGTAFAIILVIALIGSAFSSNAVDNSDKMDVPSAIESDVGYAWLDELQCENSDRLYVDDEHCLYAGTMFSGGSGQGWIEYDLNGKFARLTGCMAIIQEYYDTTYVGSLVIYADGNEIYRINEMKSGDMPIPFDLNISGTQKMRIEHQGGAPFEVRDMRVWAPSAQPAYLAHLYVTNSDKLEGNNIREGVIEDTLGNQYNGPYFVLTSYSDPGNFFSHGVTYAGYTDLLTNRKYTHFSGAYFLDAEQSDYIGTFEIFADGILVYESGPITESSGTISFNVCIDYAQTVKVRAVTEDDNPVNVILVNAIVYNP